MVDFSLEKASIKAIKQELFDSAGLRHYAICRHFVSGNIAGVGFVDIFDGSVSGNRTQIYRDVIVKGIFINSNGPSKKFVPGGFIETAGPMFVTEFCSGNVLRECDEVWLDHTFNVSTPVSGNCGDVRYYEADNYSSGQIDGGYGYIVNKIEDTPLLIDSIAYLQLKDK
jgi:hypothetical protein